MLHTGLYLEDQLNDSNTDWSELDLWGDADVTTDTSEYTLALQPLPTEQELLKMETSQDDALFSEGLFKRERRTALRH